MTPTKCTFIVLLTVSLLEAQSQSQPIQLISNNIDDILNHNEFVFINFYADWCRFSHMLAPIFESTSKKVAEEFPEAGKVVLGKVDCDKEPSIASKYHVSKYPTLKMFRFGSLVKREYRGQRSVDALTKFIREQLKNPLETVENLDDLDQLDRGKRNIIGYFNNEGTEDYKNFHQLASTLRDDCRFHAAVGAVSDSERMAGNKIIFRPQGENPDMLYSGPLTDYKFLHQWAVDKCVPLVREITFENAEELTEEGLPFMILFHDPSDTETPDKFRKIVAKELLHEKSSVNFLTADGNKFTHPLYHLGKTAKDLPLLAIDSFRHMYMWKHDARNDIDKSGLLKQFVADLHSGKLHREFHHGPDPTTTPSPEKKEEEKKEEQDKGGEEKKEKEDDKKADDASKEHIVADKTDSVEEQPKKPTSPPESLFKKLAPSRSRYTLLRDEL